MKRFLWVLGFWGFLGVCGVAFAGVSSAPEYDREYEISGWHVYVADSDIDTTAELLTGLATTYAQLAAEDEVEVVSANASDITQSVTVSGIDNNGNRVSETVALDTTAGTTATTSDTTFRYIDQVEVDKECAGVVTVRRETGDTFITSVPVGQLDAQMAQHFNGEKLSYITGWKGTLKNETLANTIEYELRWYPDDADCLDAGDGYRVLDSGSVSASGDTVFGGLDSPIKVPKGGWLAVYGTGGSANASGTATIDGFDLN